MGQRLAGPTDLNGSGIYHDENAFSMLFVVAQSLPLVSRTMAEKANLALGCVAGSSVLLACCVPDWLARRLIGLAVTTLLIAMRSKKRLFSLALVPALVVLFVWQGRELSVMKTRADTINAYGRFLCGGADPSVARCISNDS